MAAPLLHRALAGAQPQRGLCRDGAHPGGRWPGQFRSQHPRRGLAPAEALRPCLQKALLLADVVKLSREELAFISHLDDLENAIRWMMQTYPLRLLLVTLGGDGVYVHDGQRLRHFRAAPVVPVDTTGAGDAFVAGLLAALARLHELPQEAQWPAVIARAQACGALATTAKGAMTALPHADELAAFLR